MKIVFVAPGYHPRVGGVEYVVKSVAESWPRYTKQQLLPASQALTSPTRRSLMTLGLFGGFYRDLLKKNIVILGEKLAEEIRDNGLFIIS